MFRYILWFFSAYLLSTDYCSGSIVFIIYTCSANILLALPYRISSFDLYLQQIAIKRATDKDIKTNTGLCFIYQKRLEIGLPKSL
jgi:hypothetical protein